MGNITAIQGINSTSDIFIVANQLTSNTFTGLMMIVFAFILVITLQQRTGSIEKSMVISCFICSFASIFLFMMGLLDIVFVILFAVGTGLSVWYMGSQN